MLVESGGDNLTATFSRGLVDLQIFVIDVSGGDKVPAQGRPRRHALRPAGDQQDRPGPAGRRVDLDVMARDAAAVREGRPVIFCSLREDPLAAKVADWVRAALAHA